MKISLNSHKRNHYQHNRSKRLKLISNLSQNGGVIPVDECNKYVEAEANALANALAKADAKADAKALAKALVEAGAEPFAEALAFAEAEALVKDLAFAEAEADAKALADADAEALVEAEALVKAKAEAFADAEALVKDLADAKAEALVEALVEAKAEVDADVSKDDNKESIQHGCIDDYDKTIQEKIYCIAKKHFSIAYRAINDILEGKYTVDNQYQALIEIIHNLRISKIFGYKYARELFVLINSKMHFEMYMDDHFEVDVPTVRDILELSLLDVRHPDMYRTAYTGNPQRVTYLNYEENLKKYLKYIGIDVINIETSSSKLTMVDFTIIIQQFFENIPLWDKIDDISEYGLYTLTMTDIDDDDCDKDVRERKEIERKEKEIEIEIERNKYYPNYMAII